MSRDASRLLAAQAAIRAGNKDQARQILLQEIGDHPQNFRAWLWLAGLAETAQQSLDYVEEAARIEPDDPGVRKARRWAEQRLARQAPPAAAAAVAASAPIPEETSAVERVEQLRSRQQDEGETEGKGRRRLLIAAPLLLLLAAAVLTAPLWGATVLQNVLGAPFGGGQAVSEEPETLAEPQEEPTMTATPAAVAGVDDQASTLHFVSGYFSPKESSAPPEAPDVDAPEAKATATPAALQAKAIDKTSNNPRPTWTLTPSPTFTPTATPSPVPTFVSEEQVVSGGASRPAGVGPNERWIDVNLSTQRLVAYEGDRAVYNSLVSSGTWMHPTVTGQFRVWLRYTAQTMDGRRLGYDYYLPNVPYVMYFYRDYAIHGTYWHNNFGTPMSHGCVNLPTPAAEWIFNWSSIGTLVNVHY